MYIYHIQHLYKYPFIHLVISDQTCNSDFSGRCFNKQNYYYYYYQTWVVPELSGNFPYTGACLTRFHVYCSEFRLAWQPYLEPD